MSLKLCCALPVSLNCLKSTRLILSVSPEIVKFHKSRVKLTNSLCTTLIQSRWLSTNNKDTKTKEKIEEPPKNPYKKIYYGPLAPYVKAVKLFSVSSSVVGLSAQPFLYKAIVETSNLPVILAAYSFIGFFTVVTPILLHIITKKYIVELSYNEENETYMARTLNFLCASKDLEFKLEDVHVPDVPGMFVTFHIKGKPLFVDPRFFDNPDHYANLMGFNKPMDFKLFEGVNMSKPESDASRIADVSSSKAK